MDGLHQLDRLDLHDDLILYDEVRTERICDGKRFVDNADRLLAAHVEAASFKFEGENGFIDRFEQPGAQRYMNLVRSVYDNLRDLVLRHVRLLPHLPLHVHMRFVMGYPCAFAPLRDHFSTTNVFWYAYG